MSTTNRAIDVLAQQVTASDAAEDARTVAEDLVHGQIVAARRLLSFLDAYEDALTRRLPLATLPATVTRRGARRQTVTAAGAR